MGKKFDIKTLKRVRQYIIDKLKNKNLKTPKNYQISSAVEDNPEFTINTKNKNLDLLNQIKQHLIQSIGILIEVQIVKSIIQIKVGKLYESLFQFNENPLDSDAQILPASITKKNTQYFFNI